MLFDSSKKKLAMLIVGGDSAGEKPAESKPKDEDKPYDSKEDRKIGLEAAADRFIAAVVARDSKAVAEAFLEMKEITDGVELIDSEPEETI